MRVALDHSLTADLLRINPVLMTVTLRPILPRRPVSHEEARRRHD